MTDNYYSIPADAHVPPIVGEYGYFSSKLSYDCPNYYCTIHSSDNSEIHQRSVSYSMSKNITDFIPFTTNHGKIKSIDHANDRNVKYRSK